MLWLAASLLTLVDDVFSDDGSESVSELQRALRWPAGGGGGGGGAQVPWPQHFEELSQEVDPQPGRWQRSPPPRREPDSPPRQEPDPPPRTSKRSRKKTKSSRDCHLERREMRVRDLGLGYDSDEIILFKFCAGSCHSARRNYDLALKALLENGLVSGRKVSGHPCCRPTRYETVSFMDTHTTWQTIRWLSAANCSCVG